jgi:hypothetical protein
MNPIVSLKEFVQEMEMAHDEGHNYLNVRTGEFVFLTDEELEAAESGEDSETMPEWQRELVRIAGEVLGSDDYQELPTRFEIHEYAIMERFSFSVADDEMSDRLLRSIRGRGAFRFFKDTIHDLGIADDWYAFRTQTFKEMAIGWLEEHGVPFFDDL